MPGDIVVGDLDGVAVVPLQHAAEVLELVAGLEGREAKRIAEIKSGGLFKAEINDSLRAKGVVE